jgi:serine protease Do
LPGAQIVPGTLVNPPVENVIVNPPGNVVVNPQPQVVKKPVVPASAEKTKAAGVTYIALSPDLKVIADGREPNSLNELKALEKQQSQVAKSIQQVTVNIQQGSAQGSGVIITEDGFILTAAHVAGGPNRDATVILHDGTRLRARTLGMNRDHDAGLIQIDSPGKKFAHASLGRSKDLKVGQWVIGAGHPGGWQPDRGTVIRVGRIQRMMPRQRDPHTLFTDCALIGGDSGGPLFTLDGTLIGIHSRIGTEVSDNMHVPIDVFSSNWEKMARAEAWGTLPGFGPPYIGVKGEAEGIAFLKEVEPTGPAGLAGLEKGDIVTMFDGNKIATFQDLIDAVGKTSPGDVSQITIQRGNQTMRLPIQIGNQKQK